MAASASEYAFIILMFTAMGSMTAFIFCVTTVGQVDYNSPVNDYSSQEETDKKKNYTIGLVICIVVFVICCLSMGYICYSKRKLNAVSPSPATQTENGQTPNTNVNRKRGSTTIINNNTNITTCSGWTLLCCCVRSDIETGN